MRVFITTKHYALELAKDQTLAVVSRQMAAEILNLSKATIDRQIKEGSLEALKINSSVCVRASALISRLEGECAQVSAVKVFLVNVAKKGKTTTYEPVMATIGLTTQSPPHRARIGTILGEISEESYADHKFLLSSLVFNKSLGRPSDSFYGLAERLVGKLTIDLLDKQLAKIWKHYASGSGK